MRNLIVALLAVFMVSSSCLAQTKQTNTKQTETKQTETKQVETKQTDIVEVMYFHGKTRCVTCQAIETNAQEVVEKDFAKELKSGKVKFTIVDISTKEGEKIADSYEVTWSSIFVNKWKNGKETRNDMTKFAFSTAKNTPEKFREGLREKITESLK